MVPGSDGRETVHREADGDQVSQRGVLPAHTHTQPISVEIVKNALVKSNGF